MDRFIIKKPFFEIGPKLYLYGADAVRLAVKADELSEKYQVDIIFSAQYTDLAPIAERTRFIHLFAQHMDPVRPGRGIGSVLPEAVRDAGARGVLLNHAERPLTLAGLNQCIRRAREVGLATMVCAGNAEEGAAAACLSPDIILAESPALIGKGKRGPADMAEIQKINRSIHAVAPEMPILHGAGISDERDVYEIIKAGADVAIVDVNLEAAQKTAQEIQEANHNKMIAVKADITNPDEVNRMIDTILKEFGRLDAAFCNAGIGHNVEVENDTLEDWSRVIHVNLNGTFLTAQAAGRVMLRQGGGSIINTASMSAHITNVPQKECSYAASKAGVIAMSRNMAVEWADRNVRVNTISPGYMATEMTLSDPVLKPLIEKWEELIPVHRMGRPEELEAIAVYLAGDMSSYTTGADFRIDGAYTCF